MQSITNEGLVLIKHFEGFAPYAYLCAGGYRTIGYGHVLRDGEHYPHGISEAEAARLLHQDVALAARAVARLINAPLSTPRHDALVSFTFNLGAGALQRSTLRRRVNAGHHAEVPQELLRWVYAGGKRLPGLVRRRMAEAALYQRG